MSVYAEMGAEELRVELAEADVLLQRQGDLLTGVANALRGEPESGLHSHHDVVGRTLQLLLVIDDLWSHLGADEMAQLESETITVCQEIHERLYHG